MAVVVGVPCKTVLLCSLFFTTRPIFVSFAVDNDCQEREESVKLDIISCFTELLRATVVIEGQAVPLTSISRSLNDSIGFGVGGGGSVPEVMSVARGYSVQAGVRAALLPPPRLVRQRSCFDSLEVRSLTWMGGQVGKWLRHVCFTASVLKDVALYCTRFVLQTLADSIVTAALKQLSGKDGKTKVAIWTMLRHLVQALGHKITPYFPKLLPAAEVRPYHHSSAWSYLPCKVLVTADGRGRRRRACGTCPIPPFALRRCCLFACCWTATYRRRSTRTLPGSSSRRSSAPVTSGTSVCSRLVVHVSRCVILQKVIDDSLSRAGIKSRPSHCAAWVASLSCCG